MYLVPADQLHKHRQIPPPAKKPKCPKPKRSGGTAQSNQHPYDKWVKVRGKIGEAEQESKATVKAAANS